MTIWLRFGLFRAFSMHVGNEPFLTFIARNIFCFGIKGIPSSIYEIGDRYHLPKSQLWTASFAFPASKIWAKHFDDQPCSHMHNCIPRIQDTSQHISNSHYNAENEMTKEFLKTCSVVLWRVEHRWCRPASLQSITRVNMDHTCR